MAWVGVFSVLYKCLMSETSICLPACLPVCLSVCLASWLAGWLSDWLAGKTEKRINNIDKQLDATIKVN